jgi:hypothetical protein
MNSVEVEVLHTADCPHWQSVCRRIELLASRGDMAAAVSATCVDDRDDAQARGFSGSPTILVGGKDVEPRAAQGAADFGLG